MFWEEKIDILQKQFSSGDFHVPFTKWTNIIKNIEAAFIIHDSNYHYSNWSERIKQKTFIGIVTLPEIYQHVHQLESNTNYWVVIVQGQTPTSKHLVYDCKPIAMIALLEFTSADFYIIDKKYNWIVVCELNQNSCTYSISKSGSVPTPFDGFSQHKSTP